MSAVLQTVRNGVVGNPTPPVIVEPLVPLAASESSTLRPCVCTRTLPDASRSPIFDQLGVTGAKVAFWDAASRTMKRNVSAPGAINVFVASAAPTTEAVEAVSSLARRAQVSTLLPRTLLRAGARRARVYAAARHPEATRTLDEREAEELAVPQREGRAARRERGRSVAAQRVDDDGNAFRRR